MHCTNGSPVKSTLHVQIGEWLRTSHFALIPHVFGHGSEHFIFIQARLDEHSELTTHSGRQFGTFPVYPAKQEQTACRFGPSRHTLFGPHGDGEHWFNMGSCVTGSSLHKVNGSPVIPIRHSQVGICWRTTQRALIPQTPGHGSSQRWFLVHAKCELQSSFTSHSWLQPT